MFLNENKDFNTEFSEMDDKERVVYNPQYIRLDKEMQFVDSLYHFLKENICIVKP